MTEYKGGEYLYRESEPETPTGWGSWEAWQKSDQYLTLMKNLRAAIVKQAPLELALSVEDLASCAFAAGMKAANNGR